MKSQTRTTRIAFFSGGDGRYYTERAVSFTWHMGMSWQVKQRSSISLRENILAQYPGRRVIEVSTVSDNYRFGKQLSAFNLKLDGVPVENLFQGSKQFSDKTGPFTDIYYGCSPKEAKNDIRIKTKVGHDVIGFSLRTQNRSIDFEPYPYSAFYDYIYILAISQHPELAEKILEYDTFTDINFNQKTAYSEKGPFNCQARSLAIYTELIKNRTLESYLQKPKKYVTTIYGDNGRLF